MSEDYPSFDKEPFRQKYLEGEAPREQRVVAVKFNDEEFKMLEEVKMLLNCPFDSTALKLALRQLRKVLLNTLDDEVLRYLTSARRRRLNP